MWLLPFHPIHAAATSLAHATPLHEVTSFMQRPALQSHLESSDRLVLMHHEELLHAGVVEHAPLLARAYRIEVEHSSV
jgi:hypothetical protein